MVDLVALRVAASQARAKARAGVLRERVADVVTALRSLGATRVVLFGSLARGDVHEGSDVDLCVDGIPTPLGAAALDLAEIAGACVDVVRREIAPPALLRRIDEEGIDVSG